MNNKKKFAIVHFLLMCLSAYVVTLAHGIYESYPSIFTALFFPINESVWEHSKLYFAPILLIFMLDYAICGHKFKNFVSSAALALVYMPILSFSIFQCYFMIAGGYVHTIIICISCAILIIGFLVSYFMSIKEKEIPKKAKTLIYIGFAIMFAVLILFTFVQPKIEWLFMDSINKVYGFIN